MSGIYIPNMKKPTKCGECPCFCEEYYYCKAADIEDAYYSGAPDDCPLVPVPPHYDLIDHNALKIAVMYYDAETRLDFLKHVMDCINKAPVVIPSDMPTYEAEEGE